VAVALVLAGCGAGANGVADLEPDAILDQAKEAVASASSVHVAGDFPSQGATVVLDLTLSSNGDATGTVTNDGLALNLLSVDGTSWYSADEAFWEARVGPELASQLGGKYVEIAETDTTFDAFIDWGTFWDKGVLAPSGTVTKGEETTFEGQPAVELVDSVDDGVLYVSTTGEALPLGIEGGKGGKVTFTDWNAALDVAGPPPEEVIDPATLSG
jgi:hypothetical protein